MRIIGNPRYRPRVGKRKREMESISANESGSKRMATNNETEDRVDSHCWVCHTETRDTVCVTCHRSYHSDCLVKTSTSFSELGVCPECQSQSVDGTELIFTRFFNLDKLKTMLDVATRRSFGKKRGRNKIFLRWPEEDGDGLFKIIDFEILLDNINHVLPYTKTAEFYSDVKFMHHNAYVVHGANSDETKAADNLRRDFKTELLDLEACPECYYYMYCDESDQDPFVRLCECPHDIVWAQLTGHSYWPAKCLKVVKGIAHVRFFGEHEQSNIPITKCYYLSEIHPKDKDSKLGSLTNSGPKSKSYKSAIAELMKYIHLYRQKYGNFPFYPHKTAYKPHEKQNQAVIPPTEEIPNRNLAQMKLEGVVNEDSEINHIDATTVMEYSEDSITFCNRVTDDTTNPNGQYSTLDEIIPSVDATSLTTEPLEGNLNTNASAVTSINMTFSTDENHLNIEEANPVVSLLESIPSIASTSRAEIVHSTSVLPAATTNDASNDSSVQINSLNSIANISTCTEHHTELDNEVDYIGQTSNEEDDQSFNPDVLLPLLMEENPGLKSLVDKARYLSDGMVVHLWANLCKKTKHIGALSRLSVQLRKKDCELKCTTNKLNKTMKELEEKKQKEEYHEYHGYRLNCLVEALTAKLRLEEEKNLEAANNAKTIIRCLKTGCYKKIEEVRRIDFMASSKIQEENLIKSQEQLKEARSVITNMEEEIRRLKKENEEYAAENKYLKENAGFTQPYISPDTISEYKRTHYCAFCERSAAFVCCLNTSYCSSNCQAMHAEKHQKTCRNTEPSVIQQTVSQQTTLYLHQSKNVITSENSATSSSATSSSATSSSATSSSATSSSATSSSAASISAASSSATSSSATSSSANPDTSDSHSVASLKHHKKAEIQRVSAKPPWPSPHDQSPGPSSHSHSSKSRRHLHQ